MEWPFFAHFPFTAVVSHALRIHTCTQAPVPSLSLVSLPISDLTRNPRCRRPFVTLWKQVLGDYHNSHVGPRRYASTPGIGEAMAKLKRFHGLAAANGGGKVSLDQIVRSGARDATLVRAQGLGLPL